MEKNIIITIQYTEDGTVVFSSRSKTTDHIVRGGYNKIFIRMVMSTAMKFWELLVSMDKVDKFKL